MILAAGHGTRVRPLSLVRPKALFPVLTRPLISLTIDRLQGIGVRKTMVNTHHLADRLEEYLRSLKIEMEVRTVRETEILGTSGGVKNAAWFFDNEPFLLINGDVVTDIDLEAVAADHFKRRPLATLALHDVPGLNNVAVDKNGRIRGFRGRWPADENNSLRILAFTGIHVVSPEILAHIHEGPGDMVDVYQSLIDQGALVAAHVVEHCHWRNIDSPDLYRRLHRELLAGRPDGPIAVDESARIEKGAVVEGWASVGSGAVVESGAGVCDSILWPGARVLSGVHVRNCILTDGSVADSDAEGIAILPDRVVCDTPAFEKYVDSATGAV